MGRDEVLKRCSENRHPSYLLVVGAGRVWVSAPPALCCGALVEIGVVRHQLHSMWCAFNVSFASLGSMFWLF